MNVVRYGLEDLPHDLKDLKFKDMITIQKILKDLLHDLKDLKFTSWSRYQPSPFSRAFSRSAFLQLLIIVMYGPL